MKIASKILFSIMLILIGCESSESPQTLLGDAKNLENSISVCVEKINRYRTINESILIKYPESEAAAKACFNLAKLNEIFSHFETAADYYRKLLENFPESNLCPEALYKLALLSQLHLDKTDDAIAYFRQLQGLFPDSKETEQSFLDLAEIFLEKKDHKQAIQVYNEFLEKYPNHVLNDEIYYRIGKIYQTEVKDTTAAEITFRQLVEKFPESPWANAAKNELGNQ